MERKNTKHTIQNTGPTIQSAPKDTHFENDEVKIFFPENKFEQKNIVPKKPTNYFAHIDTQIRFCAVYVLDYPYIQSVRSDDGWLCELDILPLISAAEARKEIIEKFGDEYGSRSVIKQRVINGFQILQWRYQQGKTRLDHFLVFGNKHNYLFVSSPYGDAATIESIIEKIQLL